MNNLSISFRGTPPNFKQIDAYLFRSAQPGIVDLSELHSKFGITDVISFRHSDKMPDTKIHEKDAVELLGMNYHKIPSSGIRPNEKNIIKFLNIIEQIRKNNGKAIIHCQLGAHRTGTYAFAYESLYNLFTPAARLKEWHDMGGSLHGFPNLLNRTMAFVNEMIKSR